MKKRLRIANFLSKIMRITFIQIALLGLFGSVSYAHEGYSQEVLKQVVSVNAKSVEIKKILSDIERQTTVRFIFSNSTVKMSDKITFTASSEWLSVVLPKLLTPLGISYEVVGTRILLKKIDSSTVTLGNEAESNKMENTNTVQKLDLVIRGKVLDEKQQAVVGASVVLEGTTKGTITDLNGVYSISVTGENDVLVFSLVGLQTVKEKVGNRTIIDVIMREESKMLDDVVVTALGIEAQKDELGYATSRISGDNIAVSGEVGLVDALAGKASGVRISRTSGDPGAASAILIRGQSTITRGTEPLIILDGVPVSGDARGESSTGTTQQSRLNDISPDDIASVQVLKGASAAALWGTRAANGVIMITTKKGKSNKLEASFKTTYSMDEVSAFYSLQDTYGQGNLGVWSPTALRSWGDKIAARAGGNDVFNTTAASFVGNTGAVYYPVTTKNSRETFLQKNYDGVLGRGHYIDNSISLSGGDDVSNFFISFNDLAQKGVINNSTYRRTGFRVNASRQLTKWLTVSNKASYSLINSDRIQTGVNNAGFLIGLLRTPADFDNTDYIGSYAATQGGTLITNRHRSYRNHIGASPNPGFNNPLWVTEALENTSLVNRFINATEIKIRPTDWFSVTTRAGIDYFTDRRKNYFPYFSANAIAGQYNRNENTQMQFNLDVIGQVEKQLNKNVGANLLVGFNYNQLNTSTMGATSQNFILPNGPQDFDNATPSNIGVADDFLKRITNAGYTSLGLSLYDQLFVNATGRLEAASTFGDLAKKTFFYPSADFAWQFTQLGGLKNSKILSFGKFRMAYGVVGVQPLTYRTRTDFVTRTFNDGLGGSLDPALYGAGTYLQSVTRGNPFLRPERKEEIEIGTDLRFWDNKISFGVTYYQNNTKDALINIPQASSTGFDFLYTNAGNIQNKGIEIDLGYTILKNKDWTVEVNINWTRNRNLVTNLSGAGSINLGGTAGVSSRAVEGYPLSVLFSTPFVKNADGNLKLNENGFPIADIVAAPIGDPNPNWRGGAGFTVKYKKFTLSTLLEHSQGGQVINGTEGVLLDYGTSAAVGKESVAPSDLKTFNGNTIASGTTFRGNIHDFGGGPVALEQSWYTGLGGWFGNVGEQFLEDATWTRFRELNLSYAFNSPQLKKTIGLNSVIFELSGRNLFLISKVNGYDPDSNVSGSTSGRGVVYFVNPPTRSFLFTVKVNF